MNLNAHDWQFLAELIGSGDQGQKLIDLLERFLLDQDVRNRRLDGVDLHRGQGMSLLLAELVQTLKTAPDIWRQVRGRS